MVVERFSKLAVWTVPHTALPVATIALVVPFGSRHDPAAQPGLAGVVADMLPKTPLPQHREASNDQANDDRDRDEG